MKRLLRTLLPVLLLLILLLPTAQAQGNIVYGVFFYSPTCPHCHEVMDNHWPDIQERFGDQLQVIFVNVSTREGSDLMMSAIRALNLQSTGVPQLLIGDEVMVGSLEIPQRAPLIIEAGLQSGGIAYPAIPGVEAWFEDAGFSSATIASERSLSDDPANFVAIGVLLGLVVSVGLVFAALIEPVNQQTQRLLTLISGSVGWWALVITSLLGFGVAMTLVFGAGDVLVMGLAIAIAVAFIAVVGISGTKPALADVPQWTTILLLVAGLIGAAYLSYVEATLSDAVCGAIGDCNVVQQSPYARIMGVPVGFLGIVGYVLMLGVVIYGQVTKQREADSLLFGLALIGVLFSIYLTFLEPFVIGATCAWCLTSALVMLAILWQSAPAGIRALLPVQKVDLGQDLQQQTN